jgi:hypothetical protein
MFKVVEVFVVVVVVIVVVAVVVVVVMTDVVEVDLLLAGAAAVLETVNEVVSDVLPVVSLE